MDLIEVNKALLNVITDYYQSFSIKTYNPESIETDLLMEAFGITQKLKQENKQYWGRELGMCWQRLATSLCEMLCPDFKPALRMGRDEPCDFIIGKDAIDTKYRIGSGDSGTLKKFKTYGTMLREEGFTPILLFIREDNLPAAITACRKGQWEIYQGDESLAYLKDKTGFDLKRWLIEIRDSGNFLITR